MSDLNETQAIDWSLGDTRSKLGTTLLDREGGVVDLSGLDVDLLMLNRRTLDVVVDYEPCTIESAAEGIISFTFESAQVSTAGDHICYFRVTDSGAWDHWPPDQQGDSPNSHIAILRIRDTGYVAP